MNDLSYLKTEYARQKMLECYYIEEREEKAAHTARERNRKASDPAEAKATVGRQLIKENIYEI